MSHSVSLGSHLLTLSYNRSSLEEAEMHLSPIKWNYLELPGEYSLWQMFRGRTLGLADLRQVCAHHLLVLSSWARCVNGVGISFPVCEVGVIIPLLRFL